MGSNELLAQTTCGVVFSGRTVSSIHMILEGLSLALFICEWGNQFAFPISQCACVLHAHCVDCIFSYTRDVALGMKPCLLKITFLFCYVFVTNIIIM